jgi:hypothetical protein
MQQERHAWKLTLQHLTQHKKMWKKKAKEKKLKLCK